MNIEDVNPSLESLIVKLLSPSHWNWHDDLSAATAMQQRAAFL